MVNAFRPEKVLSALPPTLTPNGVYFVRVGTGIMLYVADATGSVAYTLNDGDAPIQRQSIVLQNANTGSIAFTLPIFYVTNITLLRIVNGQNTRFNSSGSAIINLLFGNGSTFVTVPGLSNRTITTTPTNYAVSNNGQLITTSQNLRVEYVSFTSGPVDIALTFEYLQ